MTISELVANTLIGVDTCAISTDADAPTIHPLQLIQEANDYPAKETRKRNLQHLLFTDHYRCSIYEIVYDDPPVSSARRYESPSNGLPLRLQEQSARPMTDCIPTAMEASSRGPPRDG